MSTSAHTWSPCISVGFTAHHIVSTFPLVWTVTHEGGVRLLSFTLLSRHKEVIPADEKKGEAIVIGTTIGKKRSLIGIEQGREFPANIVSRQLARSFPHGAVCWRNIFITDLFSFHPCLPFPSQVPPPLSGKLIIVSSNQ